VSLLGKRGPRHGNAGAEGDRGGISNRDRLAGRDFNATDEGAVGGLEVFNGEAGRLVRKAAVAG